MRVRRPEIKRPFRTPWVPFVPIMGMLISLVLIASLNLLTIVRLFVWLAIGLAIYFTYSVKHSKVRKRPQS
jgi:APA family basic amino acid/polyamine antiporter